jgi:pyruvate/2-oxoglutarate dehydrogenase complex dihydrolipoamide acyltransferase (E2) component
MIYHLSVPSVAEDVEEFRVLEWHGAPGHAFEAGDMVVELETHKAVVEVRAGRPAVLRRSVVAAGDWCKIGLPLAFFSDTADEPLQDEDKASDLMVEFEII